MCSLELCRTWQVVDVTAIEQQVSINRVAQRRQVSTQRHAASHVAPDTAVVVNAHLRRRDVGRHTEVRKPQILDLLVFEHALDALVESAS